MESFFCKFQKWTSEYFVWIILSMTRYVSLLTFALSSDFQIYIKNTGLGNESPS